MSQANIDSESYQETDPFYAGYEKLWLKTNGNLVDKVMGDTKNDVLYKTRRRIIAISDFYFPNSSDFFSITQRASELRYGLLIGLYASAETIPILARYHFYAHCFNSLDFEGDVFGGYHVDATSIEDHTLPQYRDIGSKIEIPGEINPDQNDIVQAGIGWMATVGSTYRQQFIENRFSTRLLFTRHEGRREIKSLMHQLAFSNAISDTQ